MTDLLDRMAPTIADLAHIDDTSVPLDAVADSIDEEAEFEVQGTLPTPTREECIAAIIREANCTRSVAELACDFHQEVARAYRFRARLRDPRCMLDGAFMLGVYHLGDSDLELIHPVLNIIMPDAGFPQRGSGTAHDMLTRAHLRPEEGEVALVHDKYKGVIENCTVSLERIMI